MKNQAIRRYQCLNPLYMANKYPFIKIVCDACSKIELIKKTCYLKMKQLQQEQTEKQRTHYIDDNEDEQDYGEETK